MEFSIGRSKECQIQIDHPTLSSKHCSIKTTTEDYFIVEDLDSSNHTFINNKRIKISRFYPKDKLTLADKDIDFTWLNKKISGMMSAQQTDFRKEFVELKNLYEEHDKKLKGISWKYNKKTLVIRLLISLAPLIIGYFIPNFQSILTALTGVLIAMVLMFQQANPKLEEEKREENRRFYLKYRCPKCGFEFGNRDWFLIENDKQCIKCKAQFV